MKIVTVREMRRAEAASSADGLSYAKMMEAAGSAVAQEITQRRVVQGRTVLILVGPGNNGGDGLVCARYLHDTRATIYVYLLQPRPEPDANLDLVRERKIPVINAGDDVGQQALAGLVAQADVIVDALLGTGADRPIEGALKSVLDTVRAGMAARSQAAPLRVAVDVPSGLNADTGAIDPSALQADLTVTFAFPKRGHYLFPGATYAGDLVVSDIGIPAEAVRDVALELSEAQNVVRLLPRRPRDAHKGTFGKLLVLAGSINYTGAAHLASMAAYRAGAGLVTLALARSLHPILAARSSEVTYLPLAEVEQGILSSDGLPVLFEALPDYDALLVGCGLGGHAQTRSLVTQLLAKAKSIPNLRLLVDADGLNALAGSPQWWRNLPASSVLTPHHGEMARLTGLAITDIAADRIGVATRSAAAWNQVVVLKGAYTVIVAPDGRATINPFANPALAMAGTGDVLAGVIAGLLAQGVAPYEAAVCGAFVQALAGQVVSLQLGDTGAVASDLHTALPLAIRALRQPPSPEA